MPFHHEPSDLATNADLPETTEKELSTKGHEERRRATKALRLTVTGYQRREGIGRFPIVSLSNDPPGRAGGTLI